MSLAISMLNFILIILSVSFIFSLPIISQTPEIHYINETQELPEYKVYKLARDDIEEKELKKLIESNSSVLCTFSEQAFKDSPSLVIYCFILALAWCCLIVTFCLSYLRKTAEKMHALIYGFRANRENNERVDNREEILPRLFSIQSTNSAN